MANGSESISLREFFDDKFEGIERALGRLEEKLDRMAALSVRVSLLEARVKLICGIGSALGVVLLGLLVERLFSLL